MSHISADLPEEVTEMATEPCSGSEVNRLPKGMVLHTRVVTGTGGGPEKTILNSPRYLTSHGYRAMCAFMHPPEDPGFQELQRRGAAAGATVVSIPDRGPFDLSIVKHFLRLCQKEQVTIWHAHDYKSNLIGLLVRRSWPMHLVTTAHGWVQRTWKTPLYYRLDRWCQRRYDKVICVSADLLETVRQSGTAPEKSLLIDNAIDTELNQRRESALVMKQRLGFRSDRKLIGAVGRLSGEKNFKGLIEAISRLLKQGQDVELAIAGEGPERTSLERLIAAQPEPERFHLLGFQGELGEFYQALDVFALSSLREGLPNVLLEAMAYQVPVVSTESGGVARLIENEHNGLLVPVDDVPALTTALARSLGDPALSERLSARGRQTIEERFSFAARMERICAVYKELLSK
jgi:glycosyltransferase involved in cell wall biosynthesis